MRISDWSSDVCSSDLLARGGGGLLLRDRGAFVGGEQLVDQHGERGARPSEQHGAGDQRDALLPDGADTQEPDMAVRANEDSMVLKQRRAALAQIAQADRKSTRLHSSHYCATRLPSSDLHTTTLRT